MKRILLLSILILSSYITSASAVQELSFGEQGYEDFYINGFDTLDCTKYEFVYSRDLNALVFPIISLEVEFGPLQEGDAKITTFLNSDELLKELGITDFQEGKARIWVPREIIRENNEFRVCGKTSFTVGRIKVSSESSFGVYYTAFFPKGTGFTLEPETYRPTKDVPFTIQAVARNFGSRDQEVTLNYRRGELEEYLPEITILSGDTSKTGVAPACQERNQELECTQPGEYRISFLVKANKAVPMTLLPATMSYTNIFGEKELVQANRPSIEALEPEHKISAQIIIDRDSATTGNDVPVIVKVRNTGMEKVSDISVSLNTGLEVMGEGTKTIASLEAGQSQDLEFTAKGIAKGEYLISCTATYGERELECENSNISLQGPGIGTEILLGLGFAFIALAVFAYIHFKKET